MKLGYPIVYVPDVPAALAFYTAAFVCIQPPGIDSPNARPPRRFGRGVS